MRDRRRNPRGRRRDAGPTRGDALALEPGALRHPIRHLVADHDVRVQTDRRSRLERPISHASKVSGAHPRPRASGANQSPNVAWCPSGPKRVTAPRSRSSEASTMANGAPVPARHIAMAFTMNESASAGGTAGGSSPIELSRGPDTRQARRVRQRRAMAGDQFGDGQDRPRSVVHPTTGDPSRGCTGRLAPGRRNTPRVAGMPRRVRRPSSRRGQPLRPSGRGSRGRCRRSHGSRPST